MTSINPILRTLIAATGTYIGLVSMAQAESEDELAKKLANPIAALISVPLQLNYDRDIGSANGHRTTFNIQPVIPVSLSPEWNLISRTIIPLVDQKDVAGSSGKQSGFGDVMQSLFFSPKAPTAGGVIWGVGRMALT